MWLWTCNYEHVSRCELTCIQICIVEIRKRKKNRYTFVPLLFELPKIIWHCWSATSTWDFLPLLSKICICILLQLSVIACELLETRIALDTWKFKNWRKLNVKVSNSKLQKYYLPGLVRNRQKCYLLGLDRNCKFEIAKILFTGTYSKLQRCHLLAESTRNESEIYSFNFLNGKTYF